MDNRFAYMRKYLGFSQKEELYDYIRFSNDMVVEFCDERQAEDEDEGIDEIYLRTFTVEGLAEQGLPPWTKHCSRMNLQKLLKVTFGKWILTQTKTTI